MAGLTVDEVFKGSLEKVFQGIKQYDKYPDYLPGVTQIKVLPAKKEGSTCQVRYDLKLIKSFYYTLDMYEESPKSIHWSLDESNLFKVSNGRWDLSADGDDKTNAKYFVEVGFKGFVPGKVVDTLTKANLPLMMKGFQKMINDHS